MQKETKMESLHSIQDVMQSTDHRTMLKQTRASIFFSGKQFTMMYMEAAVGRPEEPDIQKLQPAGAYGTMQMQLCNCEKFFFLHQLNGNRHMIATPYCGEVDD